MFTIKFYGNNGFRQRILEAESFTVLRIEDGTAEITLHQKDANLDKRYDIGPERAPMKDNTAWPDRFDRAIIENSLGKTSEIVTFNGGRPDSDKRAA